MTQTAASQQALILAIVGDPDGTLAGLMGQFWDSYTEKASVAPRLQALYVQRACLDVRLGARTGDVDFGDQGQSVKLTQETDHLRAMRQETQTEIQAIEQRTRANRTAQIGTLTTVAPESPPTTGQPDANNVLYSGDPYQSLETIV